MTTLLELKKKKKKEPTQQKNTALSTCYQLQQLLLNTVWRQQKAQIAVILNDTFTICSFKPKVEVAEKS